ncbi:MAG: ATP-dependent protease ATPase subunit HslU [Brevinematia bacterium]
MRKENNEIVKISQSLDSFKPTEIVKLLDNYIIGQEKAKRLVAIALRNRIRRKYVPEEMRDEILPKNILMIGPTGVGKTEIARRIAQIIDAPFVKVEATKFTERGYVGRDVEYMIRALVNHSINLVKSRMREKLKDEIEEEVLKYLTKRVFSTLDENFSLSDYGKKFRMSEKNGKHKIRNEIRKDIQSHNLDDLTIEVKLKKKNTPFISIPENLPVIDDSEELTSFFNDMGLETEETKVLTVKEAKEALFQQYMEEKLDKDMAIEIGLKWAQEAGIVFIDEIDKISDKSKAIGPEVSREGVQRDLLPIVEGTNVTTRYGIVKTDHILFIAAGAFHVCKPSDMIPELQGRFPIRVELSKLTKEDLKRILIEPKNSLIKQYKALLATEGITIEFEDDAYDKIVEIAYEINSRHEDIGARRLHTVMEYLLEEVSFYASELKDKKQVITKDYVEKRLSSIIKDNDLTQYIL